MGLFRRGEARDAQPDANTALRLAAEQSNRSGLATALIDKLLDVGVDGLGPLDSAQEVADTARAKSRSVEAAVKRVIRSHLTAGAAGGFVTGLGGFVTLTVALPANVVEFYVVATRMVAAIAALRGYDVADRRVRTAVLLTLVGADADDLLRKTGVGMPGGRLAHLATQRLPGPALMVVNKAIGFRLITQFGRSGLARLGQAVPMIGGAVGAGMDGYLLKQIADHAVQEFPPTS